MMTKRKHWIVQDEFVCSSHSMLERQSASNNNADAKDINIALMSRQQLA